MVVKQSWDTAPDDALAQQSAAGDREALDALLSRHAPTACRVAFSVLRNHDDALDAAQVALTQVAGEISSKWSGKSFKAWLCVCAHGAASNLLKQNMQRKRREQQRALTAEFAQAGGFESAAERQEALAVLSDELAELPAETAQVLLLHHIEGLPVVDVALQTGLSVDACKQRLSRGRENLRERMVRRGVGVASLALLIECLVDISGSAKAWAAELSPAQFAQMAHTASSAMPASMVAAAASGSAATSMPAGLLWVFLSAVALTLAVIGIGTNLPSGSQPSATPISTAAAVNPAPKPEPRTVLTPGKQLDDPEVWWRVTDLPTRATAERVEVDVYNPDDKWKVSAFLFEKEWDLTQGPVILRFNCTSMAVPEQVALQLYTWHGDRESCIEDMKAEAVSSFLGTWATTPARPFKTTRYEAHDSTTHMIWRIDGEVKSDRNDAGIPTKTRLGFRVISKGFTDRKTFSVEDLSIHQELKRPDNF